jgi:hypothetical protein
MRDHARFLVGRATPPPLTGLRVPQSLGCAARRARFKEGEPIAIASIDRASSQLA